MQLFDCLKGGKILREGAKPLLSLTPPSSAKEASLFSTMVPAGEVFSLNGSP
jgi:hypothetical protein